MAHVNCTSHTRQVVRAPSSPRVPFTSRSTTRGDVERRPRIASIDRSPGFRPSGPGGTEATMKGHMKQRGGRFYAVIYEGLDPATGREVRRWHPAGTDRAAAERLAAKAEKGRSDATRSLTPRGHPGVRAQAGSQRQGCERTAGPRGRVVHDRDLPARPARHAGRCRSGLRSARNDRSEMNPGERPEEDRLIPGNTPQRRRPRSLTWAFMSANGGGGRI